MTDPFMDNYRFTRAVEVKKSVGAIVCGDLRQPKGNEDEDLFDNEYGSDVAGR